MNLIDKIDFIDLVFVIVRLKKLSLREIAALRYPAKKVEIFFSEIFSRHFNYNPLVPNRYSILQPSNTIYGEFATKFLHSVEKKNLTRSLHVCELVQNGPVETMDSLLSPRRDSCLEDYQNS